MKKFFQEKTIVDALRNSKIADSFLACLCICKVLHFNSRINYSRWMTFEKSDLVKELVYYFDFETGKLKENDGVGKISIVFAKNFTSAFGKINPVYLAAVCFRKYGIPESVNSIQDLIDYIKAEFCLTEDFCKEVFFLNDVVLPEFTQSFSNVDFENMLKKQNGINEYGSFAISCGPKSVIKNSAGALGASYFQTLYSKMSSKICLITEYPEEYSFLEEDDEKSIAKNFSQKKKFFPSQDIYYGVPGTGKSFRVDAEINAAIKKYNDENPDSQVSYEKQVTRVVFHPEYGNADFIGQIMPKVCEEGGVDYVFKAGPFSKILRKAYLNPSKPYFLIIEEINRGNAAAIFGDIFQSLDRLKNDETSDGETIRNEVYKYKAGWSKYGITNEEINAYILRGAESIEKDSDVDYDSTSEDMPKAAIRIPARGMHFSVNSAIRLPPNLSLYATMNTSDQNVFTLDNAFQRRWEMKQVSNDLKNDDAHLDEKNQYNQPIGSTNVKWGDFRERINEIIMESAEENGLSSLDDKRLGGWFIIPRKIQDSNETEITDEAFAEKVLKYLWDDAFKFDRQKHFGCIKTLEELTKEFKKVGFEIFRDETLSCLQKKRGF